jgi:hypothetical protein
MTSDLDTLKRQARENELQVIDNATGHVRVIGGLAVVHWWPFSKRRTAYVDGAQHGHSNTTVKNVISLALKGTLK